MNLTLNLSPELEQYLLKSAQRRGISVEEVTLQMLIGCMQSQEQDSIASGAVCEVWSPFDAFDAAQTMLEVLTGSESLSGNLYHSCSASAGQ
ncbi:hypothetical protein [Microcoleus sp. herbarium12]|jgi:hypothetical protein|uniref:hypothetical protein n=1 Tax=Microcoleus sp. herbarium12 TaxID=3055437 RepID=UPI002FD01ABF